MLRALRRAQRLRQLGRRIAHSDCVCGLSPCLAPHCFAAAEAWGAWTGSFTPDDRSLAPYQGTPESVAAALLTLSRLQPGETFVDLGSGDGRILLHAVEHYDAGSVVGYELDPVVHALAEEHVRARLGGSPLLQRVRLVCGDAREADLRHAHVVALYLLASGHAALKPLMEAQLGRGTRVVAHGWPVPGWEANQELTSFSGARLFLYER